MLQISVDYKLYKICIIHGSLISDFYVIASQMLKLTGSIKAWVYNNFLGNVWLTASIFHQ